MPQPTGPFTSPKPFQFSRRVSRDTTIPSSPLFRTYGREAPAAAMQAAASYRGVAAHRRAGHPSPRPLGPSLLLPVRVAGVGRCCGEPLVLLTLPILLYIYATLIASCRFIHAGVSVWEQTRRFRSESVPCPFRGLAAAAISRAWMPGMGRRGS